MDIRDVGKFPVSEAKPAGDDPSYEPEFEQLQAEIDKLSMPSASGQGIDWDKVLKLGEGVLTTKGKHLPTAAYMAVALMKKKAIPGLADGVNLLADVATTFWETLYPPKNRMRGRANAIGWFREQVRAFFDAYTTDAAFPKDLADRLVLGFDTLDRFVADNIPDGPGLRDLLEFVKRLPVEAPKEETPPPAPADTGAPVQTGSGPAQGGGQAAPRPAATQSAAATPTPSDPAAAVEECLSRMIATAAVLLEADAGDPRAYALNRLGAWLKVDGLPPAEQGQTMIPPPDESIKSSIAQLVSGRQFEAAARRAESQVPVYLFWLDLSRLSAEALDSLGAKGAPALDALKAQAALYVARLKGIENMSFSDGTPFADAQTKTWLKSFALGSGQAVDAALSDSQLGKALEEARGLASQKKFVEAVTTLQDALRQARSGRERFDGLIAVATTLSQSGRADLAGPNIDELLGLIDQYRLEQWEPDTALRGLLAAYDVLSLDGDNEGKVRTRQVLSRIARINPAAAMRVSG
ncbi:type VI secretion system protein TssA [Fundidesulfovibrio terrae]|uniref:type VI secretion system protein TssA n=1 Tax=Fundidesulfovibrio terrae TaxID=2922866 RepID=UPI001FAEFC15|nr:type VI secretion system protein TssA [Fundidesulfovibrio terrae]